MDDLKLDKDFNEIIELRRGQPNKEIKQLNREFFT
jgi:hypothetical protein